MPQWGHSFCCSGWEHKARNGVCVPGRLRPHNCTHSLASAQGQTRGAVWKEIGDGGEVNRRNLREDRGSTRHCNAIPAPVFPQDHIHTSKGLQGESVQKNKGELLATVLHALNPAGFWACSWFHSNPPTRPGLSWWTRAKGMNTRSSTVDSLGESAASKILIHAAVQGLNSA